MHLEQPQIRRNHITDPQMHDIARDKLRNGDLGRSAVAINNGKMLDLGMQLLDRLLGPILVDEAEPDRQADDGKDDAGIGPLTD